MTTESVRPVCASCKEECAKAVCVNCRQGVSRDPWLHGFHTSDPLSPTAQTEICEAAAIWKLPVRPVDGGEREALIKLIAKMIPLHEGWAKSIADTVLAAGFRRIDAGEVVVPRGLVEAAQDISNFAWSALRADCTESGEEIMRRLTRLRTELTLTAAAKG